MKITHKEKMTCFKVKLVLFMCMFFLKLYQKLAGTTMLVRGVSFCQSPRADVVILT